MNRDIANAFRSRLIAAHRGARSLAPENTLAAARAALASGAGMWKIDVRMSRDGELVVIRKVVDLVRRLGAAEKVLISSFNHYYLALAKRLDRGISTGVLVNRFQSDPLRLVLGLDAFTYNPGSRAVQPRQIRRLKQKGFRVLVWVLNNPWLAKTFFVMGADGIFTDFPQRFFNDEPKGQ
jgi:glycerophosphoryl diester phosphodiesterase